MSKDKTTAPVTDEAQDTPTTTSIGASDPHSARTFWYGLGLITLVIVVAGVFFR